MKQIIHITDTHTAFDDRIFFKELNSLTEKYQCYQFVAAADGKSLYDMGWEKKESGTYNKIDCVPFPFFANGSFVIRCIRHFLPKIYNKVKYINLDKIIEKIIGKKNITPSVIHYHDLTLAKTAYKLAKFYNCKLIFDCHEFYFSYYFDKGLDKKILHKVSKELLLLKKAVKEADYVISVTKNLDSIISMIRKDDNHGIIYNSSLIRKEDLGKRTVSNGKMVLVHEGSLGFDRGLKMMLEMFKDNFIKENFKLKIVGSIKDAEKKYFEQKRNEYGLSEDNIIITGWVKYEDLTNHVVGDVGIIFFEKTFNAYYSMPNKLFNYHCANLPILCAHCADLSEMIESTHTGVIFERNIESLKNALIEIKEKYNYYYENDEKKLFDIYENVVGK